MSAQPGSSPTQDALQNSATNLVNSGVQDVSSIGSNLTDTFNKLVSGIPGVHSYGGVLMALGGIMLFLGLLFKRRFGGLSKEIMVLGGIGLLIYGAKINFGAKSGG